MKRRIVIAVAVLCASAALLPQSALAQTPDPWQFQIVLYGYFPTIGGTSTFPVDTGGGITIDASQILQSLKGGFLGSFEVKKGRSGGFTDILYLNVGDSKSNTRSLTLGNIQLPAKATADVNLDMKGLVWTIAGTFQVVASPAASLDVLAGARLLDIKQTLDWQLQGDVGPIPLPGRSGSSELNPSLLDAIVGVKGRFAFGSKKNWVMPYYFDVGTGQSQLTWQAMLGFGYAFHWGDLLAGWRYLDYNMKSGEPIESLNFNGPMLAITFRW